ncbi:M48 family metalloprotease [Thermodesulfobacteriota bacterium]
MIIFITKIFYPFIPLYLCNDRQKKYNRGLNNFIIILIILSLFPFLLLSGQPVAFALSIEEERLLGREFMENIRRQLELVDDDFVNEYINDLGNYLIRPLETKHFPFRFHIVKDNDLNAFAGPGGHIFIFTGLIEVMDAIDELAAVICHEIAHVSSRHLSHRIAKGKMIGLATMAGVLVGSLLGGEVGGAVMTGSVAAGIQKQLSYSRNDERHADQLGYIYMDKAGFDPSGIISVLTKLQQGQWDVTKEAPPYLLTHPGGTERISDIESMLSSHTPLTIKGETDNHFRKYYPLFKTILRAGYLESHDAERNFKMALEKDPDSSLAHFGLGIVLREKAEYPGAIDHFKRALKGLSELLPVLRYLSETYQLKGEDREAINILKRALKLNGKDKSSLFLMAMSYQNLEEYSKAISIYERLASMEPVKNEVFYNLGVSLGRLDRLGFAHYHFGIYFKKLNKKQKADFHFQKAKELSGNDPLLMDRLRKAMEEN